MLLPGTLMDDRYVILEEVKSGGMGAVYKASDLRLSGSVVAIKQMHDLVELGPNAGTFERFFEREMTVLTSLRHAGVPRVLNYFRHDNSLCMVMDFVAGENLADVRARGPVSPVFVIDVAEQVLDILQYLHGHAPSIMHRDVKPANLIVESHTGRILLVDFGLARAAAGVRQTAAGTPGYAPLEQLYGQAEVRSDLFSLGATMYQQMTGVRPSGFPLPGLSSVILEAPSELAAVIDRAVQMQPDDRFADAASMLLAVRLARRQQTGEAPMLPPAISHQGRRILVVDDDALVRALLKRILQREMYEVAVAEDGQTALDMALRDLPDLILSDVDMPGMSGLVLCRKLQGHKLTRDVPVVLLTGLTAVLAETEGFDAGAQDYITKPIVSERLIARVQAILRRRSGQDPSR